MYLQSNKKKQENCKKEAETLKGNAVPKPRRALKQQEIQEYMSYFSNPNIKIKLNMAA